MQPKPRTETRSKALQSVRLASWVRDVATLFRSLCECDFVIVAFDTEWKKEKWREKSWMASFFLKPIYSIKERSVFLFRFSCLYFVVFLPPPSTSYPLVHLGNFARWCIVCNCWAYKGDSITHTNAPAYDSRHSLPLFCSLLAQLSTVSENKANVIFGISRNKNAWPSNGDCFYRLRSEFPRKYVRQEF